MIFSSLFNKVNSYTKCSIRLQQNKQSQILLINLSSQQKMRPQHTKELPHYYREVKYQQNRPISKQRQQAKQAKRQEKNNLHKQILDQYKKTYKYYDQEADEWAKQKYYLDLPDLPTYDQLNKLISSTFSHAKRRENIFPIVDRQPDYTLRCVYSGRILSDAEGNMLQRCDEEHSFPQSYQRGTKSGTGRDMHAIFAACKSANGSRGNTPFGLHSDKQVPLEVDEFGTNFSGTAQNKRKTYIPKLNSGAVARSTLYILVCYKNCANEDYLPKETLKWLVNQAASQEVTLWEKHRNQQLYRLQGNRNPFIDFPKLALKIDFSEGWQR